MKKESKKEPTIVPVAKVLSNVNMHLKSGALSASRLLDLSNQANDLERFSTALSPRPFLTDDDFGTVISNGVVCLRDMFDDVGLVMPEAISQQLGVIEAEMTEYLQEISKLNPDLKQLGLTELSGYMMSTAAYIWAQLTMIGYVISE